MGNRPLSRRAVVAGIAGLTAYGLPAPAAAEYLRAVTRQQGEPVIRPRSDWAVGDREPTGAIDAEDVQLLMVHHTLIPGNNHSEDQVPKLLRDIYDFHTGPEKRWPDIAYNFMVDQWGGIWEARQGSLDGPVRGSATGGNQGFTQLCCFLGDLSNQPPTEAATASMAWLLGQLADRYAVDTTPGAAVELESLGSSRFAAGAPMTLATISGHRDVSLTECPGDAGYAFVQNTLPELVNASRLATLQAATTTTTAPPPTTASPTTTTSVAPTTTTIETSTTTETSTTAASNQVESGAASSGDAGSDDEGSLLALALGGAAIAAAGAGIVAVAKRSLDDDDDDDDDMAVAESAAGMAEAEPDDENIDVPARLGLAPLSDSPIKDSFVDEARAPNETITISPAPTPAAPQAAAAPLPGPQRVWWAVESGVTFDIERAVEELSREIHAHALTPPSDPQTDRHEWARFDLLLSKRAEGSSAAIVAARANAVFVLRSEPCLVIVTRPDGAEKRDQGSDALSISRDDVARVTVHFESESEFPDIEVTAT